jgi:hypothetical protein
MQAACFTSTTAESCLLLVQSFKQQRGVCLLLSNRAMSVLPVDGPIVPFLQYFLVKSEPDAFSIDQLEARPNQTEGWDGELHSCKASAAVLLQHQLLAVLLQQPHVHLLIVGSAADAAAEVIVAAVACQPTGAAVVDAGPVACPIAAGM